MSFAMIADPAILVKVVLGRFKLSEASMTKGVGIDERTLGFHPGRERLFPLFICRLIKRL